jgi:uncharacterized membrane protein required for colicin V production
MDVLQRLQPVDVLFAILWACIVGWGLQSGAIRQLGMLLGVYAAAILSGSLYSPAGAALAYAFGNELRPLLEFMAYVAIFFIAFGLVALIIWRAYPLSRLRREFGFDNVLGAAIGAVWGVLLLIALLTVLRYYTIAPLQSTAAGQSQPQSTQLDIRRQIQFSQIAPVLEVVTSPLWQAMVPWFPSAVSPRV